MTHQSTYLVDVHKPTTTQSQPKICFKIWLGRCFWNSETQTSFCKPDCPICHTRLPNSGIIRLLHYQLPNKLFGIRQTTGAQSAASTPNPTTCSSIQTSWGSKFSLNPQPNDLHTACSNTQTSWGSKFSLNPQPHNLHTACSHIHLCKNNVMTDNKHEWQ